MSASELEAIRRLLVIAPHPDDEVLGPGGTIARLAAMGREVHVVIATTGLPHLTDQAGLAALRRETASAHTILGVTSVTYLDLPAARLDRVARTEIHAKLAEPFLRLEPDTIFLPHAGDLHHDHQIIAAAGLVVARPASKHYSSRLWAYETLSETNWNAPHAAAPFVPSIYVEIAATLEAKLAAMEAYRSQLKPFPHERSREAIRALAQLRGAAVHRPAAEGFVLLRTVV